MFPVFFLLFCPHGTTIIQMTNNNADTIHLAVSNIAWDKSVNDQIYSLLTQLDVSYLEICPTRIWDKPESVSRADIESYLRTLQRNNLRPVAMQSLLYNYPDLRIFQNKDDYNFALRYIKHLISIGAQLGIRAIVFGSPRHRALNPNLNQDTNDLVAAFFVNIGGFAHKHNMSFCIEPIPRQQENDIFTTSSEVIEFLNHVHQPGLAINLDTGTMISNQEDPQTVVANAVGMIGHVHFSSPGLGRVQVDNAIYQEVVTLTMNKSYAGYYSVEMVPKPDNLSDDLTESINAAKHWYAQASKHQEP